MATVNVFAHDCRTVEVRPDLSYKSPYVTVKVPEEGITIHVSSHNPESVVRGRALASALNVACDTVEKVLRAVPIASLAPDVPEPAPDLLEPARALA